MSTRLIINADDYGRNIDVSRGIRHSHLNGIVTSTTCMMNMPSVKDDIQLALKETPNLGLGVHLVLTAGKPLLRSSHIHGLTSPDGNFLKLEAFTQEISRLDISAIKAEWHAQIEAFISVVGEKPTHLDSHHHTSYFTPTLLTSLLQLARLYDLPIRLPIAHGQNPSKTGIPIELVEEFDELAPKILEQFQPRSPDAFFASFYGNNATRGEFLRILGHFLPNGCFEIMCHPGYIDKAFVNESNYCYERLEELEILTDPAIRQEVEKRGIELISFAQILIKAKNV